MAAFNIGAMIRDVSTVFTLDDAVIMDTQSRDADMTIGVGLQVQAGARVDLTRGLLERNRNAGITLTDTGTTAGLVDLVVRETQSQQVDGVNGEGLWMLDGADADCGQHSQPAVAGDEGDIERGEGPQEHLPLHAQVQHAAALPKGLSKGCIEIGRG